MDTNLNDNKELEKIIENDNNQKLIKENPLYKDWIGYPY